MSKITHYPFFIDDWSKGVALFTAEERGVYISLLTEMYDNAGPIERDDRRLARVCGCDTKGRFKKVLETIIKYGKITQSGNLLTNEKMEETVEKIVKKSSKARDAVSQRWNKKPNENNKTIDTNAYTNEDTNAYTTLKPILKEDKEYVKKPLAPRSQYNKVGEPIFDQFLNVIWVHRWKDGDNRKEAYFAYCKLTDQDKALLADAMTMAKKEMFGKENQFRKSMSAWINASGWESFSQSPVQNENGMTDEQWNEWVKAFYTNGTWHPDLGAEPDKPGCRAPNEILERCKK